MKAINIIDHKGIEHSSIKAVAKYYGIPYNRFCQRYYVWKWSLEDCLTKPCKNKYAKDGRYTDHLGREFKTLKEMAETNNISSKVLDDRLNRLNWDLEKAITTPVRRRKVGK